MTAKKNHYIDSETYRKQLVKDGDRRFNEWHTSFLRYQKQFLRETNASGPIPSTPVYPDAPASS